MALFFLHTLFFGVALGSLGAPVELAGLPVGLEVTGYRSTHAFTATRLSHRPTAFLLKNFLSPEECDALMAEAEASGDLQRAETSGRTDARKQCDICCLGMQSPVVAALTREAAGLLLNSEAAQMPGSGCEDLHVLRYDEGGEFLLHYDAVSLPRVLTILYYLNGVGSTWFPLAVDSPHDHPAISSDLLRSGRGAVAQVRHRLASTPFLRPCRLAVSAHHAPRVTRVPAACRQPGPGAGWTPGRTDRPRRRARLLQL